MYTEFYCEQKELIAAAENRLEEIKQVEIVDSQIAADMLEECDYLTKYLQSTNSVSTEIAELSKTILKDCKHLRSYLLFKQNQLKGDKNV